MTPTPHVVIVTGASRGIGAACARVLAERGSVPVLFARTAETEQLAAELGGLAVRGSITDPADLHRLVETTTARFGRIDAVVASTGDPRSGVGLDEIDDEEWRSAFELLFMHVVRLARLITPVMLGQGSGAWVAIASADTGEPDDEFPLSVLRASLLGFSKLYARQHAGAGLRMNTVSPGWAWDDDSELVGVGATPAYGPIGRPARHREVADAVTYLLSDGASYITGTDLRVDGGSSRRL